MFDVTVTFYGVPEDEYEQFLTDIEDLAQDKGLVLIIEDREDD